jgi:hypothetical protein
MATSRKKRVRRTRRHFAFTQTQATGYEFILRQAPAPDVAEFPHVGTCSALVKKFGAKDGLHAYGALVALKVFIPTKERQGRMKVVTVRRVQYKIVDAAKANIAPRVTQRAKKVEVKKRSPRKIVDRNVRDASHPSPVFYLLKQLENAYAVISECERSLKAFGLVHVHKDGKVSIERRS